MKLKRNNKHSKKTAVILIGAVLLLVGSVAVFFFLNKPPSNQNAPSPEESSSTINDIDTSPPTDEEITNGYDNKQNFIEDQNKITTGEVVVELNRVQQGETSLSVNVIVYDKAADARCKLSIDNFTETVEVEQQPSYSICRGFSVPLNQITKGKHILKVSYSSGATSGEVSRQVEVK